MIKLEKLSQSYYRALIPPSSGIRELLVHESYVRLRKPFLPDVGEVVGFQLTPDIDGRFILGKRRHYKTIFLTKQVLETVAPFVVDAIGCDRFTHLVISTNLFNSIYFDNERNVIEFEGFTPKDVKHPTVVVLFGDKGCRITAKALRMAFSDKIIFTHPYR